MLFLPEQINGLIEHFVIEFSLFRIMWQLLSFCCGVQQMAMGKENTNVFF